MAGRQVGRTSNGDVYYAPSMLWRVSNSVGGACIVSLGVALVVLLVPLGQPLWFLPLALLIAWGGVWATRSWIADALIDGSRLRVRGILWSRTIERDRIRFVMADRSLPFVTWRTRRRIWVVTPLVPLWVSDSATLVPAHAKAEADRFLQRLRAWSVPKG